MATLKEYYQKDQGRSLGISKDVELKNQAGDILLKIPTRLNADFESNSLYISHYIPHTDEIDCPARIILNSVEEVLSWRNEIYVEGGHAGEDGTTIHELTFTGRIFIYTEDEIAQSNIDYINTRSAELGQSVKFRTQRYADERNKYEKPLAFISHDWSDKEEIAGPLAIQLQKFFCPVWYDEYSLKVGDSLREKIEKGLKECHKCILILTPNFLNNSGWGKREFDSVFTRELVEKTNVILPVWHGVSQQDIYQYSPSLADRVAAKWSEGVEEVARKLKISIEAK